MTNANEDDAAQNGCLAGELGAKLLPMQARHADKEGDHRTMSDAASAISQPYSEMVKPTEKLIDAGGDVTSSAPALSSAASSASSP